MKIIFDSEEQKEKFIEVLSSGGCPNEVGLNGFDNCSVNCGDCWERAIEMKVVEKSSK